MNLNELKAKAEAKAAAAETKTFTLADLAGQQAVLALPAGLHELTLDDVTSTSTSKSFRMIVQNPKTKAKYSVNINIGNNSEQASIFMSIMSHLLDQLDLKTFDLDAIKAKKGETICILGTDKVTDRGTFTNYNFNPVVLAAALTTK